ncbi:MAG: DUF620 domain-containing protein [Acidobacteriota bacterium]|nr:DUF620 domain-containing protein [Acidobacteriota bacterium]
MKLSRTQQFAFPIVMAVALHAGDGLPKGDAVLDKYIEATGGSPAYAKIHNSITKGTMEIVSQGIKGALTVYAAEPSKMYSVFEIAGVGKFEEGTDGKTAWSLSALQGARIKESEERALALRSANFNPQTHWKESYKSAECVGVETVDGNVCYKVVMAPLEGKPETHYFDKESGLMVRQTGTLKTPMGEVPVDASIGDYRLESGILMPHSLNQKLAGQQLKLTFTSIVFNTDIPKERFDLPAEIKALLAKKEK